MKNTKRIVTVLLLIVMVLTLVACGKSGIGGGSGPSPVGTYKLTGMTQDGEATSEEDIAALESFGLTITLELKEDNTGVLDMMGEVTDLTWDDKNLIIEEETVPYTFDGTTLTMDEDGNSLVFTLDNASE